MSKSKSLDVVDDYSLTPSAVPFFAARLDGSFYYHQNTKGEFTFFSSSVDTVLGYSPQQCVSDFFTFLTDSPINERVLDIVTACIKGQRQPPFELEITHQNGDTKRLEITMVPHYNDAGRLKFIESIAHDITRLHCALSAYRRKSFLLDETEQIAGMGTWDWNIVTDEVRWSEGFFKILQTSPSEIKPCTGNYCKFLREEDIRELKAQIVGALKSHQVFECSHRIFLPNDKVKYIESRGKTLFDAQGKVVRMVGTIHDITEKIEAQSQLEKAYRLVNSSVTEIYLIDSSSYRFTFVSEGACKNLGYSQIELTSMTPFDLCPIIPRIQLIEMMAPVFERNHGQIVYEMSHLRCDGTSYPVEVHLQLMESSKSAQIVAIAMDISQRKQAQQEAMTQEALLRTVVDATPDLIFYKDNAGRYVGCNKAFCQCVDLFEQDIIGQTDEQLSAITVSYGFEQDDQMVLSSGETSIYKKQLVNADGDKLVYETTKTPYYNHQGEVLGVVGVSRDVTADSKIRAELQQQRNLFEHEAHYDTLTNLPNRALFMDRLSQSVSKARRAGYGVAVFFIDIDRFKPINDSLGHDIGDAVLQQIAIRLTGCVRDMDTIARIGGDEFTAIIEGASEARSAALIANKMNIALREPIVVNDIELKLSTSIGIAMFPENGDSSQLLLKCADKAMYRVKQQGRDSFQFYTNHLTGAAFERALMESQLRTALKNKEFCLYYQAQMSLDSEQIIGLEAFVRWLHPKMGMLLPAKFIPLAEDLGLIQAIDEWVVEQACEQMVIWKEQGLGDIRIAVNISSSELVRNNLYDAVVAILERTGCSPHWLELEVTESCFVGDIEQASKLLKQFNELGIKVVIDDFGTGYSSLVNLRKLPISKLKIDQSFIQNVTENSDDASIAEAVISLGRSLGLQVVAEGVETDEQKQFLHQQQCDKAQGYLFSHPVSAEQMEQNLSLK